MLFLLLIFLLSGTALMVVIWVGTLFLQGYYYTEPTQGIAWQAPAAGFVLGLFLAFWCMLLVNSALTSDEELPYDTIFSFKPHVDKFRQPVKELWVVRKGAKEPVQHTLKKEWDGIKTVTKYVDVQSGRAYSPSGVEEIILDEGDQKTHYRPIDLERGSGYREFVDDGGWTIREYPQSGPTGLPETFLWGRFLANIALNSVHFLLWFVVLWALVRFQWGHALGLAFVMWLLMTLTVLPMMLENAGAVARKNSAASARSADIRPGRRGLERSGPCASLPA